MKAAFINEYIATFDGLQVAPLPKPHVQPGYALVKIKYASANPVDTGLAFGHLQSAWNAKFPFTLGLDFSGIIEELGSDVANFNIGDEVFGMNWFTEHKSEADPDHPPIGGAFAEYIAVEASKLSLKPPDLPWETAACIGVVGTTAYQGIIKYGKVTKGQRILIFGGSSAVGSIAIQMAKNLGAYVVTTCSTRSMTYVQQFQPDKIINYTETKWENDPELHNQGSIDVVFDCIGEKRGVERALESKIVKRGGMYISIANYSIGHNPSAHPPLSWAAFMNVKQDSDVQAQIADWIVEGKIKIPIDEIVHFAREDIARLLSKLESQRSLGKNVILIS